MENYKLEELRNEIDILDREIVNLLAQRFKLTEKVGIYKAKNNIDAQDPIRESEQFKKIIQLSEEYGLDPEYSIKIYRSIIDVVISRHQKIQGTIREGSI